MPAAKPAMAMARPATATASAHQRARAGLPLGSSAEISAPANEMVIAQAIL